MSYTLENFEALRYGIITVTLVIIGYAVFKYVSIEYLKILGEQTWQYLNQ